MDNMVLGLQLMLIGMVTVFCILLIVIYGSELLIKLINKIAPAAQTPAKKTSSEGNGAVVPVLEAAVAALTGGKGHIAKITKIN